MQLNFMNKKRLQIVCRRTYLLAHCVQNGPSALLTTLLGARCEFFFFFFSNIYLFPSVVHLPTEEILKIKISMKTVAYPGAGAELALPRHVVRSGSCKHALIGRQTG